jgi:hypothetical protein
MTGVDQGASISVDDGATFTPYYGLVNGQFYRVATDYDTPYHVCGPQQDSGTARVPNRTDFGEFVRATGTPAADSKTASSSPIRSIRYMYTQGWYHVLRRARARPARSSSSTSPKATNASAERRRWHFVRRPLYVRAALLSSTDRVRRGTSSVRTCS